MKSYLLSLVVCLLSFVPRTEAQPPTSKIISGTRASEFSYPYVARLQYKRQLLCTGTLVGSRYILTAAHCFYDDQGDRVVGDTDVVARLAGQKIRSTKVYIHPTYRRGCVEAGTDAAVIELSREPVGISPIPLLRSAVPLGASVLLVGYGAQGSESLGEDGTFPPVGSVNFGHTVVEAFGNNPFLHYANSFYFIWQFNKGESNIGMADSGGPAFYEQNGQIYLAGITCGGTGNGEIGSYSVDSRADLMKPWVDSITGVVPSNASPEFSFVSTVGGSVGQAFSYIIPVSGTAPIGVNTSALPDGLVLNGSEIKGTPTTLGTTVVQISASNAYGNATAEIVIVISSLNPNLTVRKVLLQFDNDPGSNDFLFLTGLINVGSKFRPARKEVKFQIGSFTQTFKLKSTGHASGNDALNFQLSGPFKGAVFSKSTVRYLLNLDAKTLFNELSILGFPSTVNASVGEARALPLSVTIDGLEYSTTVILSFNPRNANWIIKPES